MTSAALAGSKPLIEWILVHSNASSDESGGRMVMIRFASIVNTSNFMRFEIGH